MNCFQGIEIIFRIQSIRVEFIRPDLAEAGLQSNENLATPVTTFIFFFFFLLHRPRHSRNE